MLANTGEASGLRPISGAWRRFCRVPIPARGPAPAIVWRARYRFGRDASHPLRHCLSTGPLRWLRSSRRHSDLSVLPWSSPAGPDSLRYA